MYYVYIYMDPTKPGSFKYENCSFAFKPFYVGKGKGDRYKAHIREAKGNWSPSSSQKNPHKLRKIQKILAQGLEPEIYIQQCPSEEAAYELEVGLIGAIGLQNLTNLQQGGEGGILYHTEDTKEAIRQGHLAIREHTAKQTADSWKDPAIANKRKKSISDSYKKKRVQGVKYMWVNNGESEGKYEEANALRLLDEGWKKGRLKQGKSMWINNGEESKMLREDKALTLIKQGWKAGRLKLK